MMRTKKVSKREKSLNLLKQVLFVLALCMTVLLFTLPIVLYCVTLYSSGPTALVEVQNKNVSHCDTLSIGSNYEVISTIADNCEPYTGTVCLAYLSQWNECLVVQGDGQKEMNIAINGGRKTQDALEEEIYSLKANFTVECQALVIPFLCHYYFPLTATTDCQSPDVPQLVYTSTQEECIRIRDGVCVLPWQQFTKDTPLNCSSLPFLNATQSLMNSNAMEVFDNYSWVSNENISCRDDFILISGACFPRCDKFQEHTRDSIIGMLTCEIIGATIAIVFSVMAFVLAIYNRKNMFKFPSFLLLFFVMDVFIAGLLFLIAAINRTKLLCSSINLIEAVNNPTTFCYISGNKGGYTPGNFVASNWQPAVLKLDYFNFQATRSHRDQRKLKLGALFHYSFSNLFIWWFLHMCVFFYEVMCPFHARRMKKLGKMKYVAIAIIVIGLVTPLPGVLVALTSENHQYSLGRFPPDVCVSSEEMWFYSTVLVITVVTGIGTFMLIAILRKIHMFNIKRSERKLALTAAEKKIIVIAVIFIIFGSYSMIHIGIVTGNMDKVREEFAKYFLCESTGHIPGKCDRSEFEQHLHPYMSAVAYVFLGLIPVGVLNFIVNWERLWKSMKHSAEVISDSPASAVSLTKRFSFDRISVMSSKQFSFSNPQNPEVATQLAEVATPSTDEAIICYHPPLAVSLTKRLSFDQISVMSFGSNPNPLSLETTV